MSNHLSHDTRETGAPCVSFSPCVRGWRVQERGDLLAANTRETGELFERRSRMEADFMERFLAAVEGYQGVLEALRVADAEDYHILKIRWVSVRDDHRAPRRGLPVCTVPSLATLSRTGHTGSRGWVCGCTPPLS